MRTVVAMYDHFEDAQRAVQALVNEQFRREDINLITRDASGRYANEIDNSRMDVMGNEPQEPNRGAAAGAGIGAVLGGLGGLLLGLGALAIPGIGPVIAAGPIVAGLAGAGVGAVAGGLLGGLVNIGIPEEHAHYYAEGVRRGASLVTIRTEDQDAEKARQILNRFNPMDVESRARSWREAGWNRFDPNADPLSADQMEFNRATTTTSMPVAGDTPVDREQDQFDSGMDQHLAQDVYSRERTHDEIVDVPVTGRTVEQYDVYQAGEQAGVQDWSRYDAEFNQDYRTRFGQSGFGYDYYRPVYRYGYDLAINPSYREYDWVQLEPVARREYERRGLPSAWDDVKDAVRHAWEAVTGH